MPPKNPGGAVVKLAAVTGPFTAVTALLIPPEANSNGDIPLFIAFKMPWFGWACGCVYRITKAKKFSINENSVKVYFRLAKAHWWDYSIPEMVVA